MCRSMVDIQSATVEIRRGKKEERKKPEDKNIMACPITQGGHNKQKIYRAHYVTPLMRFVHYKANRYVFNDLLKVSSLSDGSRR